MAATEPAEIHREFERAFNAWDLDGLLDLYEDDAVLFPQPGIVVRGKDEIGQALQQFFDLGDSITLDTKEVVGVSPTEAGCTSSTTPGATWP